MTTDPPPEAGRASLADDFARLGVGPGETVLVHARIGAVGRVAPPPGPPPCDPVAEPVLGALRDVLGPRGTVVVPAFTEGNSTSSRVHRERTRGMTGAQRAAFRARMPAFDAAGTPPDGMGRFAEAVLRAPGARRSGHPQTSFAALGARAADVVAAHDDDCHLGEESPLRRLYDIGARVLLVGVGFRVCSAFHLAEYRVPKPPRRDYSCVVRRAGKEVWITYRDVDLDDSDFGELGAHFEESDHARGSGRVLRGTVGQAAVRSLELRDAVDHAVGWLSENRGRRVLR